MPDFAPYHSASPPPRLRRFGRPRGGWPQPSTWAAEGIPSRVGRRVAFLQGTPTHRRALHTPGPLADDVGLAYSTTEGPTTPGPHRSTFRGRNREAGKLPNVARQDSRSQDALPICALGSRAPPMHGHPCLPSGHAPQPPVSAARTLRTTLPVLCQPVLPRGCVECG